jgi:hypothetical protein
MPPSQQTEVPDHAIQYTFDGVKPFLDFFLLFSNRKQVMYQHANNFKKDRYVFLLTRRRSGWIHIVGRVDVVNSSVF